MFPMDQVYFVFIKILIVFFEFYRKKKYKCNSIENNLRAIFISIEKKITIFFRYFF